ncbi:hypothetical protein J1N35_034798 [Gossypium stocksii]|uniref:Reverse transcriptase zinc-binding domain-containing protein n=1 Tax=Gossypium stocksii TaxID=47602 RepID=A0A9D3USQ0_9ROSI|nr:hypothetical protein J1N35_034798 [Gossypium stocksii]
MARVFIWLAIKHHLLTNFERIRRGLGSDVACATCGHNYESVLHVLWDYTTTRDIWMQLIPTDDPFMGYTKSISSVVEQCGWQIFCLYLDDVFLQAVKEFYAHLTSIENAFIYVRGASVLFDVKSINAQYGLFDGPDEHTDLLKTMTIEELNHVLTDVYVEGTKWTVSRNDCYTIDMVTLKPHYRVPIYP